MLLVILDFFVMRIRASVQCTVWRKPCSCQRRLSALPQKTMPSLTLCSFHNGSEERRKTPPPKRVRDVIGSLLSLRKNGLAVSKSVSKKKISTLIDAHIKARRDKRSQAREYCTDEETRISPQYYEYGEFIEDGERTDLTDIMHDIENGMSFYDLSKKHGNRFIRVMKWAKEYRQSHLENKFKRVFRNMKVYYIYGSAGCGKTSYVFQKHGYDDVYRTTNYEFGWIDDYNGEKILFLDEFRSSFKISEILDYLDGQPIRIRGRHYNRVACYDTVYIVSNLSLKEHYTNIQQSEPKT